MGMAQNEPPLMQLVLEWAYYAFLFFGTIWIAFRVFRYRQKQCAREDWWNEKAGNDQFNAYIEALRQQHQARQKKGSDRTEREG